MLAVETGERHLEIQLCAGAAALHLAEGRPKRAWTLLEEALERAMTLGDDHRTAAVLPRCGEFNLKQNAPAEALRQLTRALEIVEGRRDRRCTARVRAGPRRPWSAIRVRSRLMPIHAKARS